MLSLAQDKKHRTDTNTELAQGILHRSKTKYFLSAENA